MLGLIGFRLLGCSLQACMHTAWVSSKRGVAGNVSSGKRWGGSDHGGEAVVGVYSTEAPCQRTIGPRVLKLLKPLKKNSAP